MKGKKIISERGKVNLLIAVLCCTAAAAGCTRSFFRKAADKEVAHILADKDKYPDWKIEQYHVYSDPRARFADQTNQDHPPMPQDDPAASKLSPHPQNPGKAGVANIEGDGYLQMLEAWDAENREESLEEGKQNKQATAAATTSLAIKPQPGQHLPYRIKLDQAVELGLINSREYQDAREDLYLTALPVSRQRFAFEPQFFAAAQAIREWSGSQTPLGQHNDWTVNSNAGVTQLFATGALLLANFA